MINQGVKIENKIELPHGWTEVNQDYMPNCVVLKHSNGYVTIDFEKRIFSLGQGRPQAWRMSMTYAGAGWKKRIVADAIDSFIRAIE